MTLPGLPSLTVLNYDSGKEPKKMPQRTIKLFAALAGVLWTTALAASCLAIQRSPDNLTAVAVLAGFTAWIPTAYLLIANIVDRSRTLLMMTLLEALERTEQDVVRSIKRT